MSERPAFIDLDDDHRELREPVRALCARYPGEYWRDKDRARAYPEEFVQALTDAGFLAALIPERYGGSGLRHRRGCGDPGGNPRVGLQRRRLSRPDVHHGHGAAARLGRAEGGLPARDRERCASRLQAFGVTEPTTGSDTTQLRTTAERRQDGDYTVNGQKVWISRAEHSDLLLLLARTTPKEECAKRTDGLSVFLIELEGALGNGLEIRPIRTMINHATTELFFDDLVIPGASLIGEEGRGFRYILDGMNAERILIAAECIGDSRWFIEKASAYATERQVFGRPIGANQGVQFPIAEAYAQTEAAGLMVQKAAALFDAGRACGPEANMAKLLASEASWKAGDTCLQTHGGFGFAEEYDVERKFRETRLYRVAPISTNLILAYLGQHVLGMPRSY